MLARVHYAQLQIYKTMKCPNRIMPQNDLPLRNGNAESPQSAQSTKASTKSEYIRFFQKHLIRISYLGAATIGIYLNHIRTLLKSSRDRKVNQLLPPKLLANEIETRRMRKNSTGHTGRPQFDWKVFHWNRLSPINQLLNQDRDHGESERERSLTS